MYENWLQKPAVTQEFMNIQGNAAPPLWHYTRALLNINVFAYCYIRIAFLPEMFGFISSFKTSSLHRQVINRHGSDDLNSVCKLSVEYQWKMPSPNCIKETKPDDQLCENTNKCICECWPTEPMANFSIYLALSMKICECFIHMGVYNTLLTIIFNVSGASIILAAKWSIV